MAKYRIVKFPLRNIHPFEIQCFCEDDNKWTNLRIKPFDTEKDADNYIKEYKKTLPQVIKEYEF